VFEGSIKTNEGKRVKYYETVAVVAAIREPLKRSNENQISSKRQETSKKRKIAITGIENEGSGSITTSSTPAVGDQPHDAEKIKVDVKSMKLISKFLLESKRDCVKMAEIRTLEGITEEQRKICLESLQGRNKIMIENEENIHII
jgi:hypothetical protein